MTREWIFEKGYGVKSAAVERAESLIPTQVTNNISHRTLLILTFSERIFYLTYPIWFQFFFNVHAGFAS